MKSIHEDDLLPRKSAAAILGVQPQTLAAWACTKRVNLPFVKIGGLVKYRRRDLTEFIERNRIIHPDMDC